MQVITTHTNADFDTVASMVAARKLYPEAVIAMPGTQEESVKGFLLQSALYNLEMRKAADIDLDAVTLLILVDIRNSARIGLFRSLIGKPGVEIHLYDHHPDSDADIKGSLEVVRAVGSTATIMVGLLAEKGLEYSADEATVMMLGIYEDTGSLSFPSTTPEDCRAAAILLEHGASLATVSDVLSREITSDQVSLLYDLMQGSRPYMINGVEVIVTEARREEYAGEIAPVVHRLRDMEGAGVLFAVCQMGDRVVVVARSRRPEVDVGEVMRALGGGGHPYAASAALKHVTATEIRERILEILSTRVIHRKTAADLMVAPVRSASAGDTVAAAHEMMTRYGLNAVPVMQGVVVAGIITRQVAEKAIYHGLGKEDVTEYMTTDFESTGVGDSIERVQEILIGKNQRLIPVLDGDRRLAGIITRTGLLRHLHEASRATVGDVEEASPSGGIYSRPKRVGNLMRDRLPESVMALLHSAGQVAERLGMKLYLVGGFVRDLLMRLDNLDIDLVVEGDGIAFAEALAQVHAPCRVRPHHKFGTAVVVFPDGFKLDVATARVEYYVEPGALPTVSFSSMKQDLYRRDFTINTLAVRLDGELFGELVDYFGAQRDIKDRAIRVLHSLSFVEDPTRILRACRFEQRFGFAIARHTRNLIRNAVRLDLVSRLPKTRLNNELELIFKEKDPVSILRRMSEFGLAPSIHPDITLGNDQMALMSEVSEVLVWFSLLFLDEKVDPWMVYYLALLDPVPPDEAIAFAERLGLGRRLRAHVVTAKQTGESLLRCLFGLPVVSRKAIHDIFRDLPNEVILYLMAKAKHPDIKRYISLYLTQLKPIRVFTTGEDLKAMGYPPGPRFKKILEAVHEKRLAGEIRTPKGETAWIRRSFPLFTEED